MHFNASRAAIHPAETDHRRGVIRGPMARALTECRAALQSDLSGAERNGRLGEAIRSMAHLARREEMPPERVLSLFKQMAHGVVSATPHDAMERGEILRSLTQIAIDAYYERVEE